MKKLGIYCEPYGSKYGAFYGEKFLLSSEEGTDLRKRLRKIGIDRFRDTNIPENLLPGNLPGNPFKDFELSNPVSLWHNENFLWEIEYVNNIPLGIKPSDENRLLLNPTFRFGLDINEDDSTESFVLSVIPILKYNLDLGRETPDREYAELVQDYIKESDGKMMVQVGHGALDGGWNYSPSTFTKDIMNKVEHLTKNITAGELKELQGLNEYYRLITHQTTIRSKEQRKASEFSMRAILNEKSRKRREIIERVSELERTARAA
jgi:hypothetical protein